jgi:hypothetical protein
MRTMTEADWLACTDPEPMLEAVYDQASQRKLRLFAVACCRCVWHLLATDDCRRAVKIAERFADELASEAELVDAADLVRKSWLEAAPANRRESAAYWVAGSAAERTPEPIIAAVGGRVLAASGDEMAAQSRLLRYLFGNPVRPVLLDPAWLNATVVGMARVIYDGRQFDDLPILADALEDAGCADADLLSHLRGPGPHARGCHALDAILELT